MGVSMNAVPLASRLLGCPRLPATGQGFPPQATPMGRPSWFGAPCMLQPKIPQTPMAARQELCPDAPRSAVQSLLFLARSEQRLFILTAVGENDSCSPDPRPAAPRRADSDTLGQFVLAAVLPSVPNGDATFE